MIVLNLEELYQKAKEKYRLISKKRIEDDHFLEVENYECVLANGRMVNRSLLLKNHKVGDAVVILALTKENKVFLTIQPRCFTQESVEVSFPAGLIDEQEEALDAAKRELLEEVGAKSLTNSFELLGISYVDEATSGARLYYYLAKDCSIVAEQDLDQDEMIDIVMVSFDEILEFCSADRAISSSFLTGILFLKDKIKEEKK